MKDVCIESCGDRKVFYDVYVMVRLEEHLLQILPTVRGSMVSTAGRDFSTYSGGAQPFALDDKGGE